MYAYVYTYVYEYIYDFENFNATKNDIYHSRTIVQDLGQNFAILRTSHLSYLIGFEKNDGAHRNGKCLRINGEASRYLNPADSASDISVDAFK